MEIFITLLVVVVVCVFLHWLAGKLPAPANQIGQIVVIAAGCIWLIFNLRALLNAITSI